MLDATPAEGDPNNMALTLAKVGPGPGVEGGEKSASTASEPWVGERWVGGGGGHDK